jgi:hypothetical protein
MEKYSALLVKSNGFLDVVYTDIPDHMKSLDDLAECYSDLGDGFHKVTEIELRYDSGQEGDFGGWEIEPHYYIAKDKVELVMDCYDYVTKAERRDRSMKRALARRDKLQDWVLRFRSEDGRQYELCSLWNKKPALRLRSNGGFTIYQTVKEFDSSSVSVKNLKAIKSWIEGYFTENNLSPSEV